MRSKIELAEILTVSNPSVGTEIPDERKGERERERERECICERMKERKKQKSPILWMQDRVRVSRRVAYVHDYTRAFLFISTRISVLDTHTYTHTHIHARARAHTIEGYF